MSVRPMLTLTALGILLGLFEASFRSFFPSPFIHIRPLLPIMALYVVFGRWEGAIWLGFIGGLLIELFGLPQMTLAEIRFPLIAWLLSVTSERVFTNASLYAALAMGLIARCVDVLWLWGALRISGVPFSAAIDLSAFGQTLVIDALCIVMLFVLQTILRKGWMTATQS